MYNERKNKIAISLIVLIFTVMVMLILSTAVILLVNDGAIVKKANKALKDNDLSKAKEIVIMAKTDWSTNQRQILSEGYTTLKSFAESRLQKAGFKVGNNAGELEVSEKGFLYVYKVPVIPNGFVASDLETEDEVSEGLVIYEGVQKVSTDSDAQTTRNQFVWVPVPNMNEFIPKEGYSSGSLQNYVSLSDVSEPASESVLNLSFSTDKTGEYSEYDAILDSIEKYGGFYIGRYEAGTETQRENISNGTTKVLIQKDKPVYNYVGWGIALDTIHGDVINKNDLNKFNQGSGAVLLARNILPSSNVNSQVVSHLIYGIQWDATLAYIYDVADIRNSSLRGNYSNYNDSVADANKVEGAGNIKNTGASDNWKMKNVYDLAGNVSEWTMEAFHGAILGRTVRGGNASNSGLETPVSNRLANYTYYNDNLIGFRVALYLK